MVAGADLEDVGTDGNAMKQNVLRLKAFQSGGMDLILGCTLLPLERMWTVVHISFLEGKDGITHGVAVVVMFLLLFVDKCWNK